MPYRIEWPGPGARTADAWLVVDGASTARTAARCLLRRRGYKAPWVRVVLTGPGGDRDDRFVTAASILAWPDGADLPEAVPDSCPVAAPEIERLRERALAGMDVVLEWAGRHRVIGESAAEAVKLAFDAALLGMTPPARRDG